MRTVIGNYSCWVKLLDADIYNEVLTDTEVTLVSDDSLEFLVTLTTKFGIQLIMFAKSKPCDI